MSQTERATIVAALAVVDQVISFDDSDDSACDAIKKVLAAYPDYRVIFANGGDRPHANVPETQIQEPRLTFEFSVGGDEKKNSSSWILQEWKAPKTDRTWGYYRVLHEVPGIKVKELTVEPGHSLSMQRHQHRSEYWIVSAGSCEVLSQSPSGYHYPPKVLTIHQEVRIPVTEWHQLTNPFSEPCKIVEIQYGDLCDESDIERKQ